MTLRSTFKLSKQTGLRILAGFMAIVVISRVVAMLLANYPSLWDDAYMFVRYADNLLNEGQLAWNPGGPPTYGLTSTLFLLVVVPVRILIPANAALVMVLSSFISGLLFVVLLTVLLLRYTDTGPTTRLLLLTGTFWALAITLGHQAELLLDGSWTTFLMVDNLATHFLNGMDTLFVLAYLTLFLIVAKQHEHSRTARSAILLGLIGGLAYAVRPDLLLYSLIVPLFLAVLSRDKAYRNKALLALVTSLVVLGLEIIVAALYFRSPLPLPFYAKSLHGYGQAFSQVYSQTSLIQFIAFFVSYWYLFLLIGFSLVARLVQRMKFERGVDAGLLAATAAFLLYYLFFVLHIMGFSQRYYYPTLPALIFLGAQSAAFLIANVPQAAHDHFQAFTGALPRTYTTMAVLLLLGTLLPLAPIARDGARRLFQGDLRFLQMTVEESYAAYSTYRWFALDDFSDLPNDLVIATTEVGHPGVMSPGKTIVDLTGLNEREFAHNGFSADELFARYAPDLLYMPHPDYQAMIEQILNNPAFLNDYEYFTPQELGGPYAMGVALRRDSPHYPALWRIVDGRRQGGS